MNRIVLFVKYIIANILKVIYKFNILSPKETVNMITNKNIAFSRYGDGEFVVMFKEGSAGNFQDPSDTLSKRLFEVLNEKSHDDFLIGIPYTMKESFLFKKTLSNLNPELWVNIQFKYIRKLNKRLNGYYGDNLAFRSDCLAKNNDELKKHYNEIIKIWNNKRILLIEGENTKFGIISDLFNNTQSIERLLLPSKNCFDKCYKEVFEYIKEIAHKYDKILIIAGSMATVLVYDLYKCGINSIDLGQIEKEYLWHFPKMIFDRNVISEDEYNKQIIKKF